MTEGAECSRPQAASQTRSTQARRWPKGGRLKVRTLMVLRVPAGISSPGGPFNGPEPQLPYLQSGDNDSPDLTAIN